MTFLILQILLCLLIAFLLGVLLGWWLGRRSGRAAMETRESLRRELEESRAELAECSEAFGKCSEALSECNEALSECSEALGECNEALGECETGRAALAAEAARANAGRLPATDVLPAVGDVAEGEREEESRKEPPNDLKIVEGIGPKIEGLLNARGIRTWKRLAETAVATIQEILDAAGPRYRIHDPGSWPQQARLAADGRWEELRELQDRLIGGRDRR